MNNEQVDTNPKRSKSRDDAVPRREFIQTSGTLAVAAASWWALTEKTDALAQAQQAKFGDPGEDPHDRNYSYVPGAT
jgi:hypothetical protein